MQLNKTAIFENYIALTTRKVSKIMQTWSEYWSALGLYFYESGGCRVSLYLILKLIFDPSNKKLCLNRWLWKTIFTSISGQMVYSVRLQCGKELARESTITADLVSSVPESGTAAALGYSKEVCMTSYLTYISLISPETAD